MSCIVVLDPNHSYGADFIDIAYRRFGLQTVAVYTNPQDFRILGERFPSLRSDRVAASYFADPDNLAGIADQLAQRHHIVAVLPPTEGSVKHAGELAHALGLPSAQLDVLTRFRDKQELKAHIAAQPGAPRINGTWRVRTAEEVAQILESSAEVDRFVLKPNDGYANSKIGYFDRSTSSDDLAAHFATAPGVPMIMEEFLDGQEYQVNGQVDADGNVEIVSVVAAYRGQTNEASNNMLFDEKIFHHDPRFTELADYVVQVIQKTGLRRSPFHAEVIIDDRGPCLIEVGARLVGGGLAYIVNSYHQGHIDILERAVVHYISDGPQDLRKIDWEIYDQEPVAIAYGVQEESGRVRAVTGLDEVEARPDFIRWSRAPSVTEPVFRTIDFNSHPYIVALRQDRAGIEQAAAEVADTIDISIQSENLEQQVDFLSELSRRVGRIAATNVAIRPKRLRPDDVKG